MTKLRKWGTFGFALILTIGLSACGDDVAEDANLDSEEVIKAEVAPNMVAERDAYFRDNPEFFVFATPEDVPDNLDWEDGSDLPDIGSPSAKKGGTQFASLQDFPRTLRLLGPDSNGPFRNYIQDDTRLLFGHAHPDNLFGFYPGIAEKWALSEDGLTVYVKINPEARWSDDEVVNTEDVAFTFYFMHSKHLVAPWYNDFYSTNYKTLTVYDDYTFSLTFPERKPDLLSRALEWGAYPEHFFQEFGPDFVDRYQWKFVPTTGAYVVRDEDVKKGRSIALRRKKDWWAKDKKFWRNRYNPDRIQFTVTRDIGKSFEAFKRGELDQFGLNLAEYWYEKLPNDGPEVASGYVHKSKFYNQFPRGTIGLYINRAKPLLDNNDVRVGLNYATNWEHVIESFFRGDAERMNTGSDGFGQYTHPTLSARPYSVEEALASFAKAGFTERGDDGILINDKGERLSFAVSTGYQSLADVLTILKEEAAKAGVEYRLEILDNTAGWKKVQEKKHDLALSGFGAFLEVFPRYWEGAHSVNAYDVPYLEGGTVNPERQVKPQTNNLANVAIPELDVIIDDYRVNEDAADKMVQAHRMQEILYDDASFIPGWVQPFYRVGHWRWLKYPETFNHKHSQLAGQLFVHWIDEDIKKETLAARKSGETFEPQINTYEQFRTILN